MTDDDRKALAKEIINELRVSVDLWLGRGLRKKLSIIAITLLLAGGLYFGLIKVPGALS